MAKRVALVIDFKAVYIPLPPEMAEARRASLLLLLQWIKEASNEIVDSDSNGDDGGIRAALFSLAKVAQG